MTNLATSFNDEKIAILKLVTLMKEEQNCLIDADISSLQNLTIQKAQIIREISELGNTRHSILVSAGYEPPKIGMEEWLNSAADSEVSVIWAEILSLAKSAKELNNTNGLLINRHLTRNQNTLNVLQSALPGAGFYGPDGQSKLQAATRSLVIG
jgi:flagella synthesis protein FlgN